MAELTLSSIDKQEAFREVNERSDRIMNVVILGYFIFGLVIAFFYQTFFIAVTIGGLCLLAYFGTKLLLPSMRLYQYVLSAVFAIFSAQFIYQMHGLFEMHFFFFVGSAFLITFRNWKLIIPLLLITVIHHATFAWLQYSGMKEIYFTQLDYMDLQAFIFHALLAAVIMTICGYWAYDLERTTLRDAYQHEALTRQLANVRNNIAFADQISQGNLTSDYHLLDESDELGKSLLVMRDNLKQARDREQEERFVTVGVTHVSEVIRNNGHDATALADEFIKVVVKYAGLNQGGLFIQDDNAGDDLNLAACYAFDRKKFLTARIHSGEGLVGQCFLERQEIYITQVPADYVRITSGLGGATPRCVYLVPVSNQEEIVGVIEVASFTTLTEHTKRFIRKAAENIASAIVGARTTTRIRRLLDESQQRSEDLRSQEEEIRQNMEELTATQEEMARKSLEMENRMRAVEESGIGYVEFSLEGRVADANQNFLELTQYTRDALIGKDYSTLIQASATSVEALWSRLRQGITDRGEYMVLTRAGAPLPVQAHYSVFRDQRGKPTRVMMLIQGSRKRLENQEASMTAMA